MVRMWKFARNQTLRTRQNRIGSVFMKFANVRMRTSNEGSHAICELRMKWKWAFAWSIWNSNKNAMIFSNIRSILIHYLLHLRSWSYAVERKPISPRFKFHYKNHLQSSNSLSLHLKCDQKSWQVSDFRISSQTTLKWVNRRSLNGKFRDFPTILDTYGQVSRIIHLTIHSHY